MRALKTIGKNSLRSLFEIGQRLGVDVLPRHFYSSVPRIADLKRHAHWRAAFDMAGVRGAAITEQVARLDDLFGSGRGLDWTQIKVHETAVRANGQGGGYGQIEAEALFAFIMTRRPRKVVQVGCGVSTSVILSAGERAGYTPEIVCLEPFPSAYLRRMADQGKIRLVAEGAEVCDRTLMTDLGEGDLFFVDSTHTVKPGSEVNRIILDVLPRLAAGVFVHFHDIHFPYDYQRGLLSDDIFFSVESSLLHAYLIHNARCRIVVSLSMLHYSEPNAVRRYFGSYEPQANSDGLRMPGGRHYPSATYLLMTAPGLDF